MHSSVRESWRIRYLAALQFIHHATAGHLIQCLKGIECTCLIRRLYHYTFAGDFKDIAFCRNLSGLQMHFLDLWLAFESIHAFIDDDFGWSRDHKIRSLSAACE